MKYSPANNIMLNLAAREMINNDDATIQPDHLFLGLLKLVDVRPTMIADIVPDNADMTALSHEMNNLKQFLEDHSIRATYHRHILRKTMTKGKTPYSGHVIHRSKETKALFAKAEKLAQNESVENLEPVHFAKVIMQHPTYAIAGILNIEIVPDQDNEASMVNFFQKRNLFDTKQKKTYQSTSLPQSRLMLELIQHSPHSLILLIADSTDIVDERIANTMHLLFESNPNFEQFGAITELVMIKPMVAERSQVTKKLHQTIRVISEQKTRALFLNTDLVHSAYELNQLNHTISTLTNSMRILLKITSTIDMIRLQPEALEDRCHMVWLSSAELSVPSQAPPSPVSFGPQEENSPFFTSTAMQIEADLFQSADYTGIDIHHLLLTAREVYELGQILCRFLGLTQSDLNDHLYDKTAVPVYSCALLSPQVSILLDAALELAGKFPDQSQPGLVNLYHLGAAMAMNTEICRFLVVAPPDQEDIHLQLETLSFVPSAKRQIGRISRVINKLRDALRQCIVGQDHAIEAFVEGFFNIELMTTANTERSCPKALFIFAGPPGVGKTFLAEYGAKILKKPFKRFDMSGYASSHADATLIGMPPSYVNAHQGLLTGFVKQHADAILLFDEIEKAHLDIVQLFLQILDVGLLEDKYDEENVSFRDTIIIFTTNAGKTLYDNTSDIPLSQTGFHRKTLLDALEHETDPRTGQPFFSQAICSRFATGYPILFNHMGINQLVEVAEGGLQAQSDFLKQQYFNDVTFQAGVSLCLILREGPGCDARNIVSQAKLFVKTEIFHFCQLYQPDKLSEIFNNIDTVEFAIDTEEELDPNVSKLLHPPTQLQILLVTSLAYFELWSKHIPGINWHHAHSLVEVQSKLTSQLFDLVLVDLWLDQAVSNMAEIVDPTATVAQFDFIPFASRAIRHGKEILRELNRKQPELPCLLLSFPTQDGNSTVVDEQLLSAHIRTGGVRGVLTTHFTADEGDKWELNRKEMQTDLNRLMQELYREQNAQNLFNQGKALTFETAPSVSFPERKIRIRLRNLRLCDALAANDVSEIIQNVERPTIGFDDIYGADAAKTELAFIVQWLTNPRQFHAMGLRPPKGLLLYGPPGTGKTMLARALSGETHTAFIETTATRFVTIWQGSGPQNVRDLFERARRYAPAIIFIDEIDAIGKKRQGHGGGR